MSKYNKFQYTDLNGIILTYMEVYGFRWDNTNFGWSITIQAGWGKIGKIHVFPWVGKKNVFEI